MELPASFLDSILQLLGKEEACQLLNSLKEESPVSIRLNLRKGCLKSQKLVPVPWCSSGFYLDYRPPFTFDPLLHAGCYYVQEAASMFVEQAVRRFIGTTPVVALDLCAAPGGKSTLLCDCLPKGSLLVANEVIPNRAQVLVENLTKWGYPNVVVTNNNPVAFASLEGLFDLLLADVPCSGEGMFRKEPTAVSEWSPEAVLYCRERQRRILADSWRCLKPGGILIYSTCTYNTAENEENVRRLCNERGAVPLRMEIPPKWNVTGNLLSGESFPVYRFLPHRTRGEGFFMAVLRKPAEDTFSHAEQSRTKRTSGKKEKKEMPATPSKACLKEIDTWLREGEAYSYLCEKNLLFAFPKRYLDLLPLLTDSLHILRAGVPLTEFKGSDQIPTPALALSLLLRPDKFYRVELDYSQALSYLRKEVISLSNAVPRGIVLLTYQQIPLGFAKNIGSRANNLYPQAWRIRSSYTPDKVWELSESAFTTGTGPISPLLSSAE